MGGTEDDRSDSRLNKRKLEEDDGVGATPYLKKKHKHKDKGSNRIVHLDQELDGSQDTKFNHNEESIQFLYNSTSTEGLSSHNLHKNKKCKDKHHQHSGTENNDEIEDCYLRKVKKKKKHKKHDEQFDVDNCLYKDQDVKVNTIDENDGITDSHKKKKKKKHKKEKHKELLEDSCLSIDYSVDNDLNNTYISVSGQTDDIKVENDNSQSEATTSKKRKKKKKNKDKTRRDSSSSIEFPTSDVANSIDILFIKERNESTTDESFVNSLNGATAAVASSESAASADTYTLEVQESKSNYSNSPSGPCDSPVESKFDSDKLADKKSCSKNKFNNNKSELLTGCESMEELEYLVSLGKEKEEEQLKNRLRTLNDISIVMPWPIPPLHDIETRITGRPSASQKKEMESLNVKIKTGVFTMAEDEQIKSNWSEFCRLHDLSEDNASVFLNLTHLPKVNRKQKILFARFLAHGLNNRPLGRVYGRFQKLFRDKEIKHGRFSPEEDQIIIRYMEKCKTKTPFLDLEIILKRDRLAIEKRYDHLCSKTEDKSCNWKEPKNIEKFVKRLLKITGCSDVEELKERKIEPEEWKKMSEKFHIPHHKLCRAWLNTIHPRVFIEDSITEVNIVKKKIIDKLIENGERDWRAINWNEIAKDFKGFTGLKLNKLFKSAVKYHVPPQIQHNLKDCLEYLKEKNFLKRTLTKINLGNDMEPITK